MRFLFLRFRCKSNQKKLLLRIAWVMVATTGLRQRPQDTETLFQSDSISWGLCAQLAIPQDNGPWFSKSVAQQIKETDTADFH